MNAETKSPFLAFCGILGAIALGAIVIKSVNPNCVLPPLDGERGAERKATRVELQAAAAESLGSYAVVNEANGTYSLPIDKALEIVSEEWKTPSSGRSRLLERAEKAFKVETPAPAASTLSDFE